MLPFTSSKWNCRHWTHRLSEDEHVCVKCDSRTKTGGNDDLPSSTKHTTHTHPETAAYDDTLKPSSDCTTVRNDKFELEHVLQKARTQAQETDDGSSARSSALGFAAVSTTKRQSMTETQSMLEKATCRGLLPYNFSKRPRGEVLLKCGNGGKTPDGVSRRSITRRAKKKLTKQRLTT